MSSVKLSKFLKIVCGILIRNKQNGVGFAKLKLEVWNIIDFLQKKSV